MSDRDVERDEQDRQTVQASGGQVPVTVVDAAAVMLGRPLHVQRDEQVLIPFTGRNAVALLDGEDARHVVVELEQTGIEGDRISLLRLDRGTLDDRRDATPGPRLDSRRTRHEESRVLAGAVLAAIVGAVVIGLIVWALSDLTTAIWGAIGGAALGGALGALWSLFGRVGASPAWERSLHVERGGSAVVGVHVDDDEEVARARSVLGDDRTWLFARDGSVMHRP
ncbi:MAG TPA: hypothetical protein VF183_11430 [Acidimicrobiales bacterium]